MPSTIEMVHQRYGDRGLAVVAIDIEESRARVDAWVQRSLISFPVLLDLDGKVSAAYRVTATPTVFVVARDGTVVGVAQGTKSWMGPKGRALLDALVVK